jgi:hypothetical protein
MGLPQQLLQYAAPGASAAAGGAAPALLGPAPAACPRSAAAQATAAAGVRNRPHSCHETNSMLHTYPHTTYTDRTRSQPAAVASNNPGARAAGSQAVHCWGSGDQHRGGLHLNRLLGCTHLLLLVVLPPLLLRCLPALRCSWPSCAARSGRHGSGRASCSSTA